MTHYTRRHFLQGTAAGAAFLTLGGTALAARAPAVVATDLGGGVHLIAGEANVLAFGGPEGLLLVDGGPKAQSAAVLRAALKTTGTRKLHTLFNTHWHPEQTGLNEQAGKQGARIVAQENTRLWLARKRPIVTDWLPQGFGPIAPKAVPNHSFYSREEAEFGGEKLVYGHLGQAHTDGDLYVHFTKANVLAGGGVVAAENAWPVLDWQTGGWIGGLVGGQDRLIKLCNEQTRIVGATGGVIDLARLKSQREMFMTVFDRCVKALTKGLGPDEAYETGPATEFEAQMGDSKTFVLAAFKSLWGHYAPDA